MNKGLLRVARPTLILMAALLLNALAAGGTAGRPDADAPVGGSRPIFVQQNPPAPLYSSLLTEGVRMYDDGGLHLESFVIANLPEKVEGSDATVAYGPYENQQRLTVAVKDAAGKTLGEFALAATRRNDGTWAASGTQDIKADGRQYVSRVQLGEGHYVLDFYAGGRHFYTFPFGVRRLASGTKNIYGTTGPWGDYGMFDTKGGTHWNVWMRKDDPNANARDVDIKVKVEVTRNGKVVAVNHQNFTEFALHQRDWKPYRIPLAAATPGSMSISPAALFNGDGSYEVVVTVNGAKQVYPFQVKDGRFVPHGRQAHEGTDPLRFIEDARGVYFVRRKGATYD